MELFTVFVVLVLLGYLMYLSEKYPVVSKIHPLFLNERMKEKENQQQSPALHSESYQFLVEAGRSPVICGGVEGRVFA